LNAVVGVRGNVNEMGHLTSVGITCALCHSSVDNSFTTGIGRRLDGWANTDLNVGAIVALSPALDEATKTEFNAWGPGKYDPRHHAFDGTNLLSLNSPSVPIVIPPIYGLKGDVIPSALSRKNGLQVWRNAGFLSGPTSAGCAASTCASSASSSGGTRMRMWAMPAGCRISGCVTTS
jgi:hypothetical protein